MRLLAFALMVMASFATFGINPTDSVKVLFRVGQSQFDPSLGENRRAMDSFIARVNEAAAKGDIESIVVRGYASPDGSNNINKRLAHNRCVTIADYLAANTDINRSLIEEQPMGIAWDELRRLVADNPDVPYRGQVLDILDNTPVWIFDSRGKIVDGRKKQLMDLRGGRPYNWMLANIFPQMRNAVAVKLCLRQPEPPATDTTPPQPVAESEPVVTEPVSEPVAADEPTAMEPEYTYHNFALKTNLLYDAALMPNLELEWLINDKWSVGLEWDVAWWKFSEDKVYRLSYISPEVRYHIRPHAPWHGMYVGAFAGAGLYDLRNLHKSDIGHKGEGLMAGVSIGYMWPISKHLSFDAGLGVGYLRIRDKHYTPLDGHYLYQLTKNINYFGPLKLKLSLVWRFQLKKIHSIK